MKKRISIIAAVILSCLQAAAMVNDISRHYQVSVFRDGRWENVQTCDVLCSDAAHHNEIWNDWNNSKALRDTMSLALFEHEFEDSVRIRIKKNGGFESVDVRPSTYRIRPVRIADDEIELTLPSYLMRKVSVEFDADRYHNLFLIGMRPDSEKPDPDDPSVIYFGPGEHHPRRPVVVREGQTLYVDYGAVLYAKVELEGSHSKLAGHGIISGERLKHHGHVYALGPKLVEANTMRLKGIKDITFKDITLVDSPSWTLTTHNVDSVTVDNVNIVSWTLNGDGIDIVCGKGAEIRDCFIRCYDDCITLKVRHTAYPMTDLSDVEISDCLIWNDFARGIVVGIENGNTKARGTGHIHDVLIHDCIILENAGSEDISDLRAGFAIGQFASPDYQEFQGTSQDMHDIVARDITFDFLNPTGRCVYILQYPDMDGVCSLDNVLLENFRCLGCARMNTPAILIITNQHKIRDFHIKNFTVDGKRINGKSNECLIFGDAGVRFD